MARIETVTFDSYSTLVDVEAVESALADAVSDPEPVSNHWRSRSLMYTMVTNEVDAYDTFYALNRAALEHALAAHGVDLPEAEREAILETYHELAVFDDVREGLQRLHDAGVDTYVVSNGNPDMLSSMVDHAGIGDYIADTISADEVATFKPNAELYRHAAARTGTPIDRIAHVSALFYDVLGAKHAGMTGVWLDRGKVPWDDFAGNPDAIIDDIRALDGTLDIDG
ncbi:haloacid dehalogenase type II [Natronomonas halophila]|uniref:haloacid dehalogenase type II n=1 Tax=Natronomonas halophila TaxID=2747817 RepID=UPI0015B5B8E4|nr:haloacid dehalogenase type II [Natronomonas halophila]QLD85258.1 haloacid dehalogenase type II [Natronomonas halophila]